MITTPSVSSEIDRDYLELLLAKATKGEWSADGFPNNRVVWSGPDDRVCSMAVYAKAHTDSLLIVELRNAAPALIEACRERDRLRAALEAILPPKLCGEGWDLPDDETVAITVTFGKIKAARAALGEQPK